MQLRSVMFGCPVQTLRQTSALANQLHTTIRTTGQKQRNACLSVFCQRVSSGPRPAPGLGMLMSGEAGVLPCILAATHWHTHALASDLDQGPSARKASQVARLQLGCSIWLLDRSSCRPQSQL